MKARKKPVVIEAHPISLDMLRYGPRWVLEAFNKGSVKLHQGGIGVVIGTAEGEMVGEFGDILIKGVAGELYPCKKRIFEATYEVVPE